MWGALRFELLDSLIFLQLLEDFRLSTTSTASLFTDRMVTVMPSCSHLSTELAIRGVPIAPSFFEGAIASCYLLLLWRIR
jgi:hypothetical protein